jgi:hypothetical protein
MGRLGRLGRMVQAGAGAEAGEGIGVGVGRASYGQRVAYRSMEEC